MTERVDRTLLLVRHGQYRSTAVPGSEPDGPLTDIGREQAQLTAERLRDYPVQTIHHSPLQRAVETAHILAAALPHATLNPSPLLRECIPCVPPGAERFFAHIPADFIARGEAQARAAFAAFVAPLGSGGEETAVCDLIVSHGNLLGYLASQVVQAPAASWLRFDIQQCGIIELAVSFDNWVKLVRHNDTGHLPPNLRLFV
ncbi:MAG: histidine phosphatase family protein [Anaerolineales bacterium]|nr:histidine phosphatase family protein [Anaerolineales bacterium]